MVLFLVIALTTGCTKNLEDKDGKAVIDHTATASGTGAVLMKQEVWDIGYERHQYSRMRTVRLFTNVN